MSLKSANKTEENKYEVLVSIDAEGFEDGLQKAYLKSRNKISIQGFRKGKAPRKMIEKIYGEEVFFEDAVNLLYQDSLSNAIEEAKLELVTAPEVEIVSISKENGVEFKAICTVKPEIELDNYKGIKATKNVKNVTDEDVEAELSALREKSGRLVSIDDRALENGDIAVFDFEGFVDDKAFEGGKAEKYQLEIGSGQFIPGFEEQMVGHKIDEDFDVNVTFPEEYQAKDLAGKLAVFKIKIHEIKHKELPELDDEFAKDASEFDTLAELKADITKKKEEEYQKAADAETEEKIIDELVKLVKGEIPEVMYENAVNDIVSDFEQRLAYQGMKLEDYLGYMGMDLEKFREMNKERAEKQVKLRLALEKIAVLENLEAKEEELEEEYKKLSEAYHVELEKVKSLIAKENIAKDLKVEKAMDFVKSEAKITKSAAKKAAAKKDEAAGEEKAEKKTTAKKPAAKKTTPAAEKKTTTAKKTAAKKPAEKEETKAE